MRLLGYIVYSVVWLPVVILFTTLGWIEELISGLIMGIKVKVIFKSMWEAIRDSFINDVNFIKYG
jgi:hypothetical protein